ncbi:hypothetical protein [Shewanella atlantica]|uniref:hypothetical protein n=1 Tax=Shewanella atlantica TaxID=271099 RepID=UPI001639EA92|nr:hypothetical protein [Shewanella atlantica]
MELDPTRKIFSFIPEFTAIYNSLQHAGFSQLEVTVFKVVNRSRNERTPKEAA